MIRSVNSTKMRMLPKSILAEKKRRDAKFERDSVELARSFKAGEIGKEHFEKIDKLLKQDYTIWALKNGIYEDVSDDKMIDEEEQELKRALSEHNIRRRELGKKEIKWEAE